MTALWLVEIKGNYISNHYLDYDAELIRSSGKVNNASWYISARLDLQIKIHH
jgi:hypothetical protein